MIYSIERMGKATCVRLPFEAADTPVGGGEGGGGRGREEYSLNFLVGVDSVLLTILTLF